MKQKTTKVKRREILNRARTAKPDRKNYTFRLPEDLMDKFEETCNKEKVSRTQLLEELIRSFLDEA